MIDMTKGIYCYIDNKNDNVVYVGKDSHIGEKRRRKAHKQPHRYNEQQINRVIQSNPSRYRYEVLWEIDDCSDNHLNQMEIYFISKHKPAFNFTRGGDGAVGLKHSEEFKAYRSNLYRGRNNPNYKDFARVVKAGLSEGQQRYLLVHQGINIGMSVDRKMLDALASLLNRDEIKMNEAKNIIQTHHIRRGKEHNQYKEYARVVHRGFRREKRNYCLMFDSRPVCNSTNKAFLMDLADKINTGQDMESIQKEIRDYKMKRRNKTGFYRVDKCNNDSYKQGFFWRYRCNENGQSKSLSSTSLMELKKKVVNAGLEWRVVDERKARESILCQGDES